MDSNLREVVPASVLSCLVLTHYGLIVTVVNDLPGEYDANFSVLSTCGLRLIVKVMHSSRSEDLLDMQVKALEHASDRASVALPRTLRSRGGEPFVRLAAGEAGGHQPPRFLWVLHWIEGKPYALASPRAEPLLTSLGEAVGSLASGLDGFAHHAAARDLKWDILKSGWVREYLSVIEDPARAQLVTRAIDDFDALVLPAHAGGRLRRGVIHGDVNDYNVIVRACRAQHPHVAGILDFGDMHNGIVVADLAITIAYGIADSLMPLDNARAIVRGYVSQAKLTSEEIAVLWPLVAARLTVSVINSALRKRLEPNDPYIVISEAPNWASLARVLDVPVPVATAALHEAACVRPPLLTSTEREALFGDGNKLIALSPSVNASFALHTFGEGEVSASNNSAEFAWLSLPHVRDERNAAPSPPRAFASVAHFCSVRPTPPRSLRPGVEPACCLLGAGLLLDPGTPVFASRPAFIAAFFDNSSGLLLGHNVSDQVVYTSWRGLNLDGLIELGQGARLAAGTRIGSASSDGLGIVVCAWVGPNAMSLALQAPIWTRESDAAAWRAAGATNPTHFINFPAPPTRAAGGPVAPLSSGQAAEARRALFGSNVRLSYSRPIRAVRGDSCFLIDASGTVYLDAYNNVPSVGHAHPHVAKAIAAAASRLQTNTRYLNDAVLHYASQLISTFPPPLSVVFLVASGSEANDLALRIARTATGRKDIICLDHAYHGHTNALIDVSPYKFAGKGGKGKPRTTHVAPCPDLYRGPYRYGDVEAGSKYAADGVGVMLDAGVLPAAFIAETLPSVAGQIELPSGYLAAVYERVRSAGGVCIADEVQTGFGRLGPDAFWAFTANGVVPDIVTLGKPIGNGFPMGAVVTTRELASKFDTGMEYFCTGGGGPCAAAAGSGVLDVLSNEKLPESAARVGSHLKERLKNLMDKFTLIGDVRGRGLFLGIEFVRDRTTLEEAGAETCYIVNRLRDKGILCGTEGPHYSVIKVRPPLCFTEVDADHLIESLSEILQEDGLQHDSIGEGSDDNTLAPRRALARTFSVILAIAVAVLPTVTRRLWPALLR